MIAGATKMGGKRGDRDYDVTRDIPVRMSDGVELLGDLRLPTGPQDDGTPTVLIRSPYGRTGIFQAMAATLASHGFPTFVQTCRGTFGSGGTFRPQLDDESDGIETHRWVRDQGWFTGKLATYGLSYLGYTQWAVAGPLSVQKSDIAPDALCLQVTMPDFGAITWENGAFSLRNALGWTRMMAHQDRPFRLLDQMITAPRDNRRAFEVLPLTDGDRVAGGSTVDWYQDWLKHEDLQDEYWTVQSHTAEVSSVSAPISMVTGWYDIFLPWMLRNYAQLSEAGNAPQLVVGPWGHSSPEGLSTALNEGVDFLKHTFLGGPARRAPVSIMLTGADQWFDLPSWPPPGTAVQSLYAHVGGELVPSPSKRSDVPTAYTYDPGAATPSLGGPSLEPKGFMPGDNAAHEQRSDVVTFTGDVLSAPVDVAGEPTATVYFRSDRPSYDVFVRICDVHPDGRSMTVCDGIRRVGSIGTVRSDPTPDAEGVRAVEVPLWPTAHRFAEGHRIRIQISSGAFPRYARNLGSTEAAATATALNVAHQEVFHDQVHVTAVHLPVWEHS